MNQQEFQDVLIDLMTQYGPKNLTKATARRIAKEALQEFKEQKVLRLDGLNDDEKDEDSPDAPETAEDLSNLFDARIDD